MNHAVYGEILYHCELVCLEPDTSVWVETRKCEQDCERDSDKIRPESNDSSVTNAKAVSQWLIRHRLASVRLQFVKNAMV
jgi:hypothetical protein